MQVSAEGPPQGWILLLEDDLDLADLIGHYLRHAGYAVMHGENGERGMALLAQSLPDLIVSDVMMPEMDGLQFLGRLREDPRLRSIPVILLTTKSRTEDIIAGFELGADDYVIKPFQPAELLARVQSKLARPPVPLDEVRRERESGLLTEAAFLAELKREWLRAKRGRYDGVVAKLKFGEMARLRTRLGPQLDRAVAAQVSQILKTVTYSLALFGRGRDGSFLIVLPAISGERASLAFERLAQSIMATRFVVSREQLRLTPSIGFCSFYDAPQASELPRLAALASEHAGSHLDLQPSRFTPEMLQMDEKPTDLPEILRRGLEAARLPVQMFATFVIAWLVPFGIYVGAGALGADISVIVYITMVIMIVLTALFIWIEGVLAMRRIDPPPASSYPAASAIIAAYLPNEAATLESTVEAFLRLSYPGQLQIILAYNTPQEMPFEKVLQGISARDSRFTAVRVSGSTSKAQNVNAALSIVNGRFLGIFDADHQPDPGCFSRAWDWLASGYDVVQGRCFIRNGNASWVAQTVAIEFEQIYAVAHPGRARLHGFGIFGGSNGYWRTDLLRKIRMRGFMLTEDIDSSLRVLESGGRIASDPYLISRELAPTDLSGLTNQRLRWAQGWFQVSLRRFLPLMRSPHLTLRNKFGVFHLLIWREIFPWVSLQIFPIIAYWAYIQGGLSHVNWFVPLLLFLTIVTMATGPGQILFTWTLAAKAHRRHPGWFLRYLVTSFFLYAEYKNCLSRVAQIKEMLGEKAWKVTPRSAS